MDGWWSKSVKMIYLPPFLSSAPTSLSFLASAYPPYNTPTYFAKLPPPVALHVFTSSADHAGRRCS
ncbi:hypothetical protein BKA81DRAFT_352678 [Phyllosticta paracitricarpa]